MLIDGTLSSLDSRVSGKILQEIRSGPLFRDKIVIMVTYDLDQAEQLDWVLHLSDDGRLLESMSTQEFFSTANIDQLKNQIKQASKNEEEQFEISEETSDKKGIIQEEEKEVG